MSWEHQFFDAMRCLSESSRKGITVKTSLIVAVVAVLVICTKELRATDFVVPSRSASASTMAMPVPSCSAGTSALRLTSYPSDFRVLIDAPAQFSFTGASAGKHYLIYAENWVSQWVGPTSSYGDGGFSLQFSGESRRVDITLQFVGNRCYTTAVYVHKRPTVAIQQAPTKVLKDVLYQYKADVWTDPLIAWANPQVSWAAPKNQYANGLSVNLKVTRTGPQQVEAQAYDGKYYSTSAIVNVLSMYIDKPTVSVEWRAVQPTCIGEWIDTPKGRICTKWSSPNKPSKPHLVWSPVSAEHAVVSHYEVLVGGVIFTTVSNNQTPPFAVPVNASATYTVRACESDGLCGNPSALVAVGASG